MAAVHVIETNGKGGDLADRVKFHVFATKSLAVAHIKKHTQKLSDGEKYWQRFHFPEHGKEIDMGPE